MESLFSQLKTELETPISDRKEQINEKLAMLRSKPERQISVTKKICKS